LTQYRYCPPTVRAGVVYVLAVAPGIGSLALGVMPRYHW
jgi:hypothetical protein